MAETGPDAQTIPNDPPPGMVICDVTGKLVPEDETVVLHGKRVGAEGKALLLDQLAAGMLVGGEMEKPSIWARWGAMIVDGFVLGAVYIAAGVVFGVGAFAAMSASDGGAAVGATGAVVGLAAITVGVNLVSIAYFALLHARNGQTLGKMAAKIRVVNLDGSSITFSTALIRALWYQGPGLITGAIGVIGAALGTPDLMQLGNLATLYIIASIITALVNSHQRSIHDLLSGTRVIRVDE